LLEEKRLASGEVSAVAPLPDKPSIAVLPFDNLSGDPDQEYFADGMTEDIITGLLRFRSLFVIARNSTFAYKGKSPDVREVARELGVRYILEGSVRRGGASIRITGQLIDAEKRLREAGVGASEIARKLGIGRASVYRILEAESV